jgi:Brp/Blh family beta-carotene 15,15'-monooxygenase
MERMLSHIRNRSFLHEASLIGPWLILSILYISGIRIPDLLQYIIFLISMIAMGIPHGALDHLVEKKNKESAGNAFSIAHFLFFYILRMLIFALVWIISPLLALIIFLGISALHFGETDLYDTSVSTFLYGTGLLFFLLTAHVEFVSPIIRSIPTLTSFDPSELVRYKLPLLIFSSILPIIMILIHSKPMDIKLKLVLRTSIILFLMYNLPLLLAFTFYFGCWHSIRSMDFIRQHLSVNQEKMSWNTLCKKALPFTAIAILFIFILGYVLYNMFGMSITLMSLFIGVAILTAPHLSVMSDMYTQLKKASSIR